ncbi:2'-5' RNA ligase family protein [Acaryochloris sp. IP29b_bin.148]|uniref:2'-5' RNA ligase family protein n=1 Tax=Acaryochloris sp. IP29b_bin.148 TaxID=2969218 RepID=UPI00262AAA86|nr:2'-5' RNA ligase family protein [Acaryochloris sp. IP29b_bin.148]
MTQNVSLWLVPQPDDHAYLQDIIDQLAVQYQAPHFSPHVTVAGHLQVPDHASLSTLAAATPFLQLQNQGLDHSSELFRTVYIRTSLADQLVALRQKVYQQWPVNISKPFMPHISLIYKKLAAPERQMIIQSLSLKKTFIFDALAVVQPQQDWTAVETWQILERWPLAANTMPQ